MTYNDIKERISNLNSKEKLLLFYLVENDLYRFTPVEISRVLGVTNKTVINRLKALCINGFVVPKLVNERIRSYELSALTRSKTKSLRELLEVGKTTSNIYSDVLPDYRIVADILEAVFIELYLKLMGYDVNNKPFRNNSDYFRNALVRRCYSSDTYSVNPSNQYLNLFYENLLLGADNILDSFDLFISNN